MALQFQAPSFVQPKSYDNIPRGIDDLFNSYVRGRQAGAQNQLTQAQIQNAQTQAQFQPQIMQAQLQGQQFQNAAAEADFRGNPAHGGFSPTELNQASAGLQSMYASPQQAQSTGTNQPPSPASQAQGQPMGQMGGPQQVQQGVQGQQAPQDMVHGMPVPGSPQEFLQAFRKYQANQMGAAAEQQRANLAKTEAEAAKTGAEAGLTESQIKMMGGSSDMVNNWTNKIKSGKATLADLSSFGRGEVPNALRMAIGAKLGASDADINALNAEQVGRESLAKGGAIPIANTKTLQSALDVLETLNQDAPRKSLQLINDKGLKIAAATGDRASQRLLNQAGIVSDLFQNNFGGGSDKKLELAAKLADGAQTTSQLSDSINLMRTDLKNRISGYSGQQGSAQPSFDDKQGSALSSVPRGAQEIIQQGLKSGLSRQAIKAQLMKAGH